MAGARKSKTTGKSVAKGSHFLVVEARFYDGIADALLKGAVRTLEASGVTYDVITVPGSLEIPGAIAMALDAKGRRYDGVVALGCVIRGETIHFEIVSEQSARGLMDLAIARKVPLGNGILTVNTEAQAWARAKPDEADKGGDAARAALAMLAIKRDLAKGKRR